MGCSTNLITVTTKSDILTVLGAEATGWYPKKQKGDQKTTKPFSLGSNLAHRGELRNDYGNPITAVIPLLVSLNDPDVIVISCG